MTTAEKIVYSVNADVNDEATTPLNDQTPVVESTNKKETGCSFKARIAIAGAVVMALCLGGAGLFYGLKYKK
jgi:hypothetical protein